MRKSALVVGITGQDGAYLAHHLLDLGYRVFGSSRDAQLANTSRLELLGILSDVEIVSLVPNDFRSVLRVVSAIEPNEIYNLAGQTSVGLSFDQPVECIESITIATLNFLEVIRFLGDKIRFFSAGSSESFGNTGDSPANEETHFHPRSPYAVAKVAAFWQVATYREAYNIYACTGLLANHESPLRPKRFVTQKIIDGVRSIRDGRQSKIQLGNLDIWRDWGWAPDYVKAMHLMLQADSPSDFLIASGCTVSLRQFAELAFSVAGLDISDHLESLESLKRPSDITFSSMNPSRIAQQLGWKPSLSISEIVSKLYLNELF